jgi:hypothetical protein
VHLKALPKLTTKLSFDVVPALEFTAKTHLINSQLINDSSTVQINAQ